MGAARPKPLAGSVHDSPTAPSAVTPVSPRKRHYGTCDDTLEGRVSVAITAPTTATPFI